METEPHHSGPSAPTHPAIEDFKRIEVQKRALEQVIRIAEGVERLNSGLQAVILMGKPSGAIEAKALRFFQELDSTTRILPTPKLQSALQRLEEKIGLSLSKVLTIAANVQGPEGLVDPAAALTPALLDEFRRAAQTAVALRLVLRDRGVPTRPTPLPLEPAQLREHVRTLSAQELRCREQITSETVKLIADSERLMNNEGLPTAMRQVAANIVGQLRENLAHLEAGKSIEELPHRVEVVEMEDQFPLPGLDGPPPVPSRPKRPASAETATQLKGLVWRVNEWLNTPWNVSWDEIKRRERSEKKSKK